MHVVGKGPTYLWNMSALTGINISVIFLCYGTILLVLKLRKTIIVTRATIAGHCCYAKFCIEFWHLLLAKSNHSQGNFAANTEDPSYMANMSKTVKSSPTNLKTNINKYGLM